MTETTQKVDVHGIPARLALDLLDTARDERLAWVPSQRWVLVIDTVVSKARTVVGYTATAAITLMDNNLVAESAGITFTVDNETFQACLLELTDTGARLQRDLYLRARRPRRQS